MLGVVKIGSAIFNDNEKDFVKPLKTFIKSFDGNLTFVSGAGPKAK